MKITKNAADALKGILKNNNIIRIRLEESVCCKRPVAYVDIQKEGDAPTMIEGIPVVFDSSAQGIENRISMYLENGQILTVLES